MSYNTMVWKSIIENQNWMLFDKSNLFFAYVTSFDNKKYTDSFVFTKIIQFVLTMSTYVVVSFSDIWQCYYELLPILVSYSMNKINILLWMSSVRTKNQCLLSTDDKNYRIKYRDNHITICLIYIQRIHTNNDHIKIRCRPLWEFLQ